MAKTIEEVRKSIAESEGFPIEKIDEFTIERPEKWGGNLTFKSYDELEKAFVAKELHPGDLKTATANYINQLLDPVRKHFNTNAKAKALMEKVKSFEVTK